MPFIGKTPAQGFVNSVTKDDFTPNGTTTAFTLSKTPATVHEIEVYVGNVRQEPTDAYSVSGTTLTMTEAPATGTNFYVMHIGGTTQSSTVVGDGTVTSAKLSGALTTPSNLTVGGVIDATTATFDRASTDGVIVNLQKNNGSIGSIDVDNGDNLTVQGKSDHSGLQFGTNAIFPHKNSANIDATIDLGESTLRWKDIYLSGGVNFSANANATGMTSETLDDYEEGTWTPTVNGLSGAASGYSAQIGHYTKIGNIVVAYFRITLTNKGNISGNYALIKGLPFNHSGSDGGSGMVNRYTNLVNAVSSLGIELGGSTPTAAWLTKQSGTSGTSDTYVTTADIANNTFVQGSLIYRTS